MKTKRIAIMMLCLFMCVIMGGESILSALFISANAEDGEGEIAYTNAYNDLLADKTFDPSAYPEVGKTDPKYYSLELITIAESESKELFVYVYQPSADEKLHAASIDVSQTVRLLQTSLLFSSTSLKNPSCSPILFLPFSE